MDIEWFHEYALRAHALCDGQQFHHAAAAAAGDGNDLDIGIVAPEFRDDLQPVGFGHKDIGDDQLYRLGAVKLHSLPPARHGERFMTGLVEQFAEGFAQCCVIVND